MGHLRCPILGLMRRPLRSTSPTAAPTWEERALLARKGCDLLLCHPGPWLWLLTSSWDVTSGHEESAALNAPVVGLLAETMSLSLIPSVCVGRCEIPAQIPLALSGPGDSVYSMSCFKVTQQPWRGTSEFLGPSSCVMFSKWRFSDFPRSCPGMAEQTPIAPCPSLAILLEDVTCPLPPCECGVSWAAGGRSLLLLLRFPGQEPLAAQHRPL